LNAIISPQFTFFAWNCLWKASVVRRATDVCEAIGIIATTGKHVSSLSQEWKECDFKDWSKQRWQVASPLPRSRVFQQTVSPNAQTAERPEAA
jgi:hypothetical protein